MNPYLQTLKREHKILSDELRHTHEAAERAVLVKMLAANKVKQHNYLHAFDI